MLKNIEIYIMIFYIYAFAGWVLESIGGIFNPKVKKFVNRGFLIGPYCPVYGIGIVLISLLLNKYINDISAMFFLGILICGILEYSTGYIMEKLFNARWWDYSNRKFNINGRICLETLIPFGIIATLIMCKINPFIIENLNRLNNNSLHIITGFLSICFIIDFIISFRIILSFKGEIRKRKDNTEEIVELVKEKTDEIGEKLKDKAEDVLMKTESELRFYGRKYKLKFLRKTKYTRKSIAEGIPKKISDLHKNLLLKRIELEKQLELRKVQIDKQLKEKLSEYEEKIKERNIITKQTIENFKKTSTLRARLINAFPNLEIKDKKRKDNKH